MTTGEVIRELNDLDRRIERLETQDSFVSPAAAVGGAPADAAYVVLAYNGNLSQERLLQATPLLAFTDGGANNPVNLSTTATQGSVLFAGPAGAVAQDNTQLFYDNANDYLGIGTAVPAAVVEVNAATATDVGLIVQTTDDVVTENLTEWRDSGGNAISVVDAQCSFGIGVDPPAERIHVVGSGALFEVDAAQFFPDAGAAQTIRQHAFAANAGWVLRRANTSKAAPSDLANGNIISNIDWQGWNDGNYRAGARIQVRVDAATGTANEMPCRMLFFTSPDGTSTLAERMRISNSGVIGINTLATANAQLEIVSGSTARIVQIIRGAPVQAAHLLVLQTSAPANFFESSTGLTGSTTTWNVQGVDINYIVKANGVADAFVVDGAAGQITLGALGAGFVQSTAGGVLSSAAIGAGDLPAHTHSGAGQGGSLVVGTTDTDATAGSVFFAGVAGVIQEDNANLFWDDGNNRLGIGTVGPDRKLDVLDASNPQLRLTHTDSVDFADFQVDTSGVLTITPSGAAFVVGDGAGTENILLDGAAGSVRDFIFRSGGSNRWILRVDATAEGGANAGSDFQIASRTDAGGALSTVVFIKRSTGNVGINTIGPDRRLDVLDASNPQLRLTHTDGAVYTDLQTTASGYLFIDPSADRTGFRTSTPSYIVHIPWQAGDAVSTLLVGDSTAAANNQIAVRGDSWSNVGIRGTSETSGGVQGISISGDGGNFQSTSGQAIYGQTTTGVVFRANLLGAGAAIAQFDDNGTTVVQVNNGGSPPLEVIQPGAGGAVAVLGLEQDDIGEPFIHYDGTSVNGAITGSLVDQGDQSGIAVEGWVRIQITDTAGNIANGDYWIPFYSLT